MCFCAYFKILALKRVNHYVFCFRNGKISADRLLRISRKGNPSLGYKAPVGVDTSVSHTADLLTVGRSGFNCAAAGVS